MIREINKKEGKEIDMDKKKKSVCVSVSVRKIDKGIVKDKDRGIEKENHLGTTRIRTGTGIRRTKRKRRRKKIRIERDNSVRLTFERAIK